MAINSLSTGFRPGVCTSSTRPTAPYEGQVIYETDTDLSYVYGGTAWQQVSGGTAVGNSGLVYITSGTLSTATTNFQGCFTSTYKNYRVIIEGLSVSASSWTYIRFLVGAVANTVSSYENGGTGVSSNGSVASRSASASNIGYLSYQDTSGLQMNGSFDVITPQTTNKTTIQGQIMNYQAAYSYSSQSFFIMHNSATQFDGFQVISAGVPTLTGTVTVYGYRQA